MAGVLTLSSEEIIAQCDAGIYGLPEGSMPLDLLARGMVERHTGDLEKAKDLLGQAYWQLEGEWKDKAGVQLSAAYYQGGESSEAWALLDTLPIGFDVLIMQAIIQADSDPQVALETLGRAEHYDVSGYKRGRWHSQRGICFRRLGDMESAKEEYKAAMYFLGDCPLRSQIENNLGAALYAEEAHAQLDSAIQSLKGPCLAQAYDLKARKFLEQGEYERAEQYSLWALGLLAESDRRAWLAESLFTYAEILIKLKRHAEALSQLLKVADVAEYLGDREMMFKAAVWVRDESRLLSKTYHIRCVELALDSSESLIGAARKLKTSRQALKEFMQGHRMDRRFIPRRNERTKTT